TFEKLKVNYKWSDHATQLGKTRKESNTILVDIINKSNGCCIKVDDFEKIRNEFKPKFDNLELIQFVKEFVESLQKTGVTIVVIKAVLECISLTPKECLVFEDSPHGVHLALSQNIEVIWVQDKLMEEYFKSYKNLYEHNNVYIFSSFKDNQLDVDQAIPCITFCIQDLYLFQLKRKETLKR
ncbi:33183_t:CDS:2, partial [Gigaspora margarita]